MSRPATPDDVDTICLGLPEDQSTPFFTIGHFGGYNAVLVQCSRLGELDFGELAEVITDAWLARAPKRLAAQFLAREPARVDG